ncbi:Mitochondrial inner membrane magnesium transporter mrs2 [Porphyridium purpureum]|uniref:Mitochondrial inner membrane magnesium transporter mrs2 n=1 Tax=Porphyridium purpureum TaxID=35688 RepID=A0A5J4YUH2_PORPP|nr:Mitochondrial inner membrane magnesium transporter mrs2 [Porphyridium purpureum]|eukprot:POR9222..scf227_4
MPKLRLRRFFDASSSSSSSVDAALRDSDGDEGHGVFSEQESSPSYHGAVGRGEGGSGGLLASAAHRASRLRRDLPGASAHGYSADSDMEELVLQPQADASLDEVELNSHVAGPMQSLSTNDSLDDLLQQDRPFERSHTGRSQTHVPLTQAQAQARTLSDSEMEQDPQIARRSTFSRYVSQYELNDLLDHAGAPLPHGSGLEQVAQAAVEQQAMGSGTTNTPALGPDAAPHAAAPPADLLDLALDMVGSQGPVDDVPMAAVAAAQVNMADSKLRERKQARRGDDLGQNDQAECAPGHAATEPNAVAAEHAAPAKTEASPSASQKAPLSPKRVTIREEAKMEQQHGPASFTSFSASAPSFPNAVSSEGSNAKSQQAFSPRHGLDGRDSVAAQKEDVEIQDAVDKLSQRAAELDFLHFEPDGSSRPRSLSRHDILEEARLSMPTGIPKRSEIARLLSTRKLDLDDVATRETFASLLNVKGKKSTKKALHQFLQNDLQARDIRQVDPAFSAKPTLWVRHSAIVLNLEGVRALICHDKLFLFNPTSKRVTEAARIIEHRLRHVPNMDDAFMPFEFQALEGVLMATVMALEHEFEGLEPQFKKMLKEDLSGSRLTTMRLEQLRFGKNQLNQFLKKAHGFQTALGEVLEEDEDMSNMYLTEKYKAGLKPRNPLDHDEVEMLLESYLQVVDDIASRAELLDEAVDDMEELVGLHLDSLRNKLLILDLVLSILSMMITFGGMIAGFFGMNLEIPPFFSDGSKYWFLAVVLFIIVSIALVSWFGVMLLKRAGLYIN